MTELPPGLFSDPLPGLRRSLSTDEGGTLNKYLKLLTKWQKTVRLVGSIDPIWLVENVLVDSIAFLELVPSDARAVADVGSGAGIPGIPIAVVRPDLDLTLIEPRRRRSSFLSTAIRELELTNASVVDTRIEEFAVSNDARFDAAVMRCVFRPDDVPAAVMRIVKPGGVVISAAAADEVGVVMVEPFGGRSRSLRVWRRP